jgi:hypothetical protein
MLKQVLSTGVAVVAVTGGSRFLWSQASAGEPARKWALDCAEALTGWTVTGDVSVDGSKGRESSRGSLKVGPGARAALKLCDADGSGKIDVWVHDDGTTPEHVKAIRVGPRWGLMQSDGKVLVIGALYANYLGGDEGYTASACDGKDWFDRLFWLGLR